MIKTQDPDWRDIDTMLKMLLDGTEREMIVKTCRRFVERQTVPGNLLGTLDINFHSAHPEWNTNVPMFRERLYRYQQWNLPMELGKTCQRLAIWQNNLKFSRIARNHLLNF
ncbi:hypothetical protein Nmel_008452 [Mimus melanotis]